MKKRQSRRGLTITELLVGLGIATAVISIVASQLSGTQSYFTHFIRNAETEEDIVSIFDDFSQFFSRGRKVTFEHIPSSGRSASAATSAGFSIWGNGVITLLTDLRQCSNSTDAKSFNPVTSDTNLSRIVVTCCGKQGEAGFNKTNTACSDEAGLSFQIFTPAGVRQTAVCYKGFVQMNVDKEGFHYARGQDLYHYDFLTHIGAASSGDATVAGSERRVEIYEAPGNTGSAALTLCKQIVPKIIQ